MLTPYVAVIAGGALSVSAHLALCDSVTHWFGNSFSFPH